MKGNQENIASVYVPFIPPTDPQKGRVTDVYRRLCNEVNDFFGAEFVPLMDEDANDEQSEFLKNLGVEVNAGEITKEQRTTLQLAARLHRGLFDLGKQAHENEDLYAAEKLLTTAIIACEYVKRLEHTNPDLMDQIAQSSCEWPTLATLGSAPQNLPPSLGVQFTKAQGIKNDSYARLGDIICRQYALWIITVLRMNQSIAKSVGHRHEQFMQSMRMKHACDIAVPNWFFKCATLPELNRTTVDQWMAVGRALVQNCCPDFYKREEWNNYNRRAQKQAGQGRKFAGIKKREIFNDIKKAMRIIVLE